MITDQELARLKAELAEWKKSSAEFEGKYNRQKLKNQKYEAKSDNEKIAYWRNKYWNLLNSGRS